MTKPKTLIDLLEGQRAIIKRFTDDSMAVRLLEMGCFVGTEIQVVRSAPFGDPLYIKAGDNLIALRKTEAYSMIVEA